MMPLLIMMGEQRKSISLRSKIFRLLGSRCRGTMLTTMGEVDPDQTTPLASELCALFFAMSSYRNPVRLEPW